LEDLSNRSGLGYRLTREALNTLFKYGIGRLEGREAVFKSEDSVSAAALAVKLGCSVEEASRRLSWRSFEGFVSQIFAENGYRVKTGLRLKEPRMEIDIVAYREGLCMAVDCKHWGRTVGASTMRRVVLKQVERSRHLLDADVSADLGLNRVYPVVATLFEEGVRVIEGVPVVPVMKLSGFLLEFEGYLDLLVCASR